MTSAQRVLPTFMALCLTLAGLGHWHDIATAGWRLAYAPAPLALNIYWSSLAVADIAAAVLLLLRRRTGLVFTLVILVSDVAINSYATYQLHLLEGGWALQLQSLFLGLVLGSLPALWPHARPPRSGKQPLPR